MASAWTRSYDQNFLGFPITRFPLVHRMAQFPARPTDQLPSLEIFSPSTNRVDSLHEEKSVHVRRMRIARHATGTRTTASAGVSVLANAAV